MRRVLAIALVLAGASVFAILGTGASNGGSYSYRVRVIFQNAFSLVPGEDVKVAGVKVGKIRSLDVTPEQTAAVTIEITRPGFGDFRQDAECTIRPQSLIGEKFVECTPTQPHPAGVQPPPALPVIPDGKPGAGDHLLSVEHTTRPVDPDLLNNVMRLPYRERLGVIINEFGTGLASRGQDLRKVIRDADPALKATDRVLNLLAGQNRVLSDLAKQSDISLAPLARDRENLKGFVVQAADLATATAEKQAPFEQQFQKLPRLLSELRPTMARLGQFADQATPVLRDLRAVAPSVNRLIKAQGPFSRSGTVALQSLGKATVPGTRALVAARGIATDLKDFGRQAKPLTKNLAALLGSLKSTGGVERILDYAFYQMAAINGYDGFGHYLRALLIVNLCTPYATQDTKSVVCSANFQKQFRRSAASGTGDERDVFRAAANGTLPTRKAETPQPAASAPAMSAGEAQARTEIAQQATQGSGTQSDQRLLDYLLGGNG